MRRAARKSSPATMCEFRRSILRAARSRRGRVAAERLPKPCAAQLRKAAKARRGSKGLSVLIDSEPSFGILLRRVFFLRSGSYPGSCPGPPFDRMRLSRRKVEKPWLRSVIEDGLTKDADAFGSTFREDGPGGMGERGSSAGQVFAQEHYKS